MLFSKKWLRNHQKFLLHFLIHIDVLMLCRKFEPIPTKNFRVMSNFKNEPIFEKSKGYSPWFFPKKWLRNHLQFLLHFLIHIDVLMLCRKFEPIPTKNFRVMSNFKNEPIFEKSKGYSPWFFPKKWLRNHLQFLLNFLIHIDVLMLCIFEL